MRIRYGLIKSLTIRQKLVRNPNYSGRAVGPFGWRAVPLEPAPNKEGFHAALRKSIKKEGFRNPVVVYQFDGEYFLSFGGSRVCAAQHLNIMVPCILNDFDDDGPEPDDVGPDNWHEYFRDPPLWHEFSESGFDYHYHIERNRRESFDRAGIEWVNELDDKEFLQEEFPWLKL